MTDTAPVVTIDDTVKTHVPALQPFKSGELVQYGNSLLLSLVQHRDWEDEVREQHTKVGQIAQFVTFELTKAVMEAAERNDKINLYKIFDTGKEVERLNAQFLVAFGVQRLEPSDDGDKINRVWTDNAVRDLYAYTAELKEKNEPEFQRRFNNRKRLNQRMSDAVKAAITLVENKNKSSDLKIERDETTGESRPVIENAPREIAGEAKRAVLGGKVNLTGASHSPTVASLIKIAKSRQDAKQDVSDQRSDLGANRPAEPVASSMGMNDEAFGEIVNNLRIAVTRQENHFSVAMVQHLVSIRTFLNELTLPDVVAGKIANGAVEDTTTPNVNTTPTTPAPPAAKQASKAGASRKSR